MVPPPSLFLFRAQVDRFSTPIDEHEVVFQLYSRAIRDRIYARKGSTVWRGQSTGREVWRGTTARRR